MTRHYQNKPHYFFYRHSQISSMQWMSRKSLPMHLAYSQCTLTKEIQKQCVWKQNFSGFNSLIHNISETIIYQVNPSLNILSGAFCVHGQAVLPLQVVLRSCFWSAWMMELLGWAGCERLDNPSPWTCRMVLKQVPNVILNFTLS